MLKKILPLFLVLILSFTFVGCDEGGELLPPEQLDQILAEAASATEGIETYQFDMDMAILMNMIGGDFPGEITMGASGDGAINNVDNKMKLIMTMTMDMPGLGEQTMEQESYFIEEWMYTMASVSGTDIGWMKMEMPEGMWETQNQLDQQIEFLTGDLSMVTLIGSEKVAGVDCYVFEVTPDMADLVNYLSQQQGLEGLTLDLSSLITAIKEFSIKEWVAKDSYLCMKSSNQILMEMSPELVGAASEDFEKMTMNMDIDMTFHSYNEPVSIVLPPEAYDAEEIPTLFE
jgi:hypothetical protein